MKNGRKSRLALPAANLSRRLSPNDNQVLHTYDSRNSPAFVEPSFGYHGHMAANQKNPVATVFASKGGQRPRRRGPRAEMASSGEARESVSANPRLSTSKQALHICLKRLKFAKDESELRRLTGELQRIVFHKLLEPGWLLTGPKSNSRLTPDPAAPAPKSGRDDPPR
jgi:hypothetical protein